MSVDLPDMDDEIVESVIEKVEDEKETAVKMAFIGAGQAGGNIADAFWKLGYRRVAVVNTTEKDMKRLMIPSSNRLVMKSPGGAGKNPITGRKCAEAEKENIRALIQKTFKKGVEQIMICSSAAGGTGAGSIPVILDVCRDFMKMNLVENANKKVGVMLILPTRDESPAAQHNALQTLEPLLDAAEKGMLSPLVIIDNARAMKMYGGASAIDVWGKINKNVTALFDVFNILSAQEDESVHQPFDPEDYKTVLSSGVMVFGRTKLTDVTSSDQVSNAVRDNITKGLLVEGLDISRATVGAGILVADRNGLNSISAETMEEAFRAMNGMMNKSSDTKLHQGIYETNSKMIHLYTIMGNLGRPSERIKEMEAKAGGMYPLD